MLAIACGPTPPTPKASTPTVRAPELPPPPPPPPLVTTHAGTGVSSDSTPPVYQSGTITLDRVSDAKSLRVTIEGVNRARFPEAVEAYVYVRDASGNFIAGLAPPNAAADAARKIWETVREEVKGKPCRDGNSGSFTVHEFRDQTSPARTLMFVADHSGSMEATIASVQRDIVSALQELRFSGARRDHWGLLKFDEHVDVVLPPDQSGPIDTGRYLRGLEGFGGGTALRDAIARGINELARTPESAERTLVVFTDGYENASLTATWSSILDDALKFHVQIHVIGYGSVEASELAAVADRTGGFAYMIAAGAPVDGVFRGIAHKTRVFYRATYRPCPGEGPRTLWAIVKVPGTEGVRLGATYTYTPEPPAPPSKAGPGLLVLFAFDQASVSADAYGRLSEAVALLRGDPTKKMILTGHTDSRGEASHNHDLGLRRARAVEAWLISHGVGRGQVEAHTVGSQKPRNEPDYPDEWKARENRRVEFELVTK